MADLTALLNQAATPRDRAVPSQGQPITPQPSVDIAALLNAGAQTPATQRPLPPAQAPQTGIPTPTLDVIRANAQEDRVSREARVRKIAEAMGTDAVMADTSGRGAAFAADLARSTTPEAFAQKFSAYYPLGSFGQVRLDDGEEVTVWRPNSAAPWRELSGMGSFLGAAVSEPTAFGLIGELGGPPGAAAGAAAGTFIQQAVEALRGYQPFDPQQAAQDAALSGVVGGAASGVAAGVAAGARKLGGGNIIPQSPQGTEAARVAQQYGLHPTPIGAAAASPLIRQAYFQAGGTSGVVAKVFDRAQESLMRRLEQEAAGFEAAGGMATKDLGTLVELHRRKLDNLIAIRPVSAATAGDALQTGIEAYKVASKKLVDRQYAEALALADGVHFNLAPARAVAKEVKTGILTNIKPQKVKSKDPTAKPVKLAKITQKLTGELKEVTELLLQSPDLIGRGTGKAADWTGFEKVKALRTRLFDLKSSTDPFVRREATKLWSALTDVMGNPLGNGSDDFYKAYRTASVANRNREYLLDKSFVARAVRSDSPEKLVDTFTGPTNYYALETLQEMLPPQHFKVLQDRFKANVLLGEDMQPGYIEKLLLSYRNDMGTLQKLVSPAEINSLRQYAALNREFDQGLAKALLDKDAFAYERARMALNQGTHAQLVDLVTQSGGINSANAQAIKAGAYRYILEKASTFSDDLGHEVLDPNKLIKEIDNLEKSGKARILFSPEELNRLRDWRKYAIPFTGGMDTGGSIQRGVLASRLTHPATVVPTAIAMARINLVARLLSNPASARMLDTANLAPLQRMALAMAITHDQMNSAAQPQQEPLQ